MNADFFINFFLSSTQLGNFRRKVLRRCKLVFTTELNDCITVERYFAIRTFTSIPRRATNEASMLYLLIGLMRWESSKKNVHSEFFIYVMPLIDST